MSFSSKPMQTQVEYWKVTPSEQHWAGDNMLTPAEVKADRIARAKLIGIGVIGLALVVSSFFIPGALHLSHHVSQGMFIGGALATAALPFGLFYNHKQDLKYEIAAKDSPEFKESIVWKLAYRSLSDLFSNDAFRRPDWMVHTGILTIEEAIKLKDHFHQLEILESIQLELSYHPHNSPSLVRENYEDAKGQLNKEWEGIRSRLTIVQKNQGYLDAKYAQIKHNQEQRRLSPALLSAHSELSTFEM